MSWHFMPWFSSVVRVVYEQCEMCVCNNYLKGPGLLLGYNVLEELNCGFYWAFPSDYRYLLYNNMHFLRLGRPSIPTRKRHLRRFRSFWEKSSPVLEFLLSQNQTTWSTFITEVVWPVAKGLKITWKLRGAYHPQSSGKAEWMNQTLMVYLSKLF